MRDRRDATSLVVGDGWSLRCGHRGLELLARAAASDAFDGGDRALRRTGARERERFFDTCGVGLLQNSTETDLLDDLLHGVIVALRDRTEAVIPVMEVSGSDYMSSTEDLLTVELVIDHRAAGERGIKGDR